MTPVHDARVRLTRLIDEGATEMAALNRVAGELAASEAAIAAPQKPSDAALALVALLLHRYYTALETMLERVARLLDESTPDGPSSHRDLLEQMAAELPPLRPAVLDRELVGGLLRLLSFRHFVRHAYDVPLDPGELTRHLRDVHALHPKLRAALERFFGFVRATRDSLPA